MFSLSLTLIKRIALIGFMTSVDARLSHSSKTRTKIELGKLWPFHIHDSDSVLNPLLSFQAQRTPQNMNGTKKDKRFLVTMKLASLDCRWTTRLMETL